MKIANDHAVSIHYSLKNDAGEVIDSSIGANPLLYLQGHQHIVPGFESALEGCEVGDKFQVSVAPAEGYGEKDARLTQAVPREMFGGIEDIEVGMRFQAQTPEGQIQIVEVIELNDSEVIVDGNHELAGETLHFDVEVVEVREATKDEINSGEVHSSCCSPGSNCCE